MIGNLKEGEDKAQVRRAETAYKAWRPDKKVTKPEPILYTEGLYADAADISVKVNAHDPGRSRIHYFRISRQ